MCMCVRAKAVAALMHPQCPPTLAVQPPQALVSRGIAMLAMDSNLHIEREDTIFAQA